MTYWARAAIAALALTALTGCAQQLPGTPVANEPARLAHVQCVRATNDAVVTVKTWLSGIDTFGTPQIDSAPFRAMRVACDAEFVPAYSDFLARIHTEFAPVTVVGRASIRQFMNDMCRNDTGVGVKVDQLTDAAQKACRGS